MTVHDARRDDRSVGQLARDAAADIGGIVDKEVRLGRAEISERLGDAREGLVEMLIGAVILIPAFTIGLLGAAWGLATIDGLSMWSSALIVAFIAAFTGLAFMLHGKKEADPKHLFPERTVRNVKRDAAVAKEAI